MRVCRLGAGILPFCFLGAGAIQSGGHKFLILTEVCTPRGSPQRAIQSDSNNFSSKPELFPPLV